MVDNKNHQMKITDLIAKLQAMPQHADVLIDTYDLDTEEGEYVDFSIELGDIHEDAALVIITMQ